MIREALHLHRGGQPEPVEIGNLKAACEDQRGVLWLDVQDPTEEDLALLKREFDFHDLALEDTQLPHERPKVDEYDNYYFVVFYALEIVDDTKELRQVELDLFVGHNYLVAVHKSPLKEIDEALHRWKGSRAQLGQGTGSLVYSLLDSLVDGYFQVADTLAEQVATIEESVFQRASQRTVQSVFDLKKRLLALRRVLGPERDVLNALMRQDIPLLDARTIVYLRDVYDHLTRITDTVDLHSDLLTSALDVYLSTVSNRLNQVVKTLTSMTIILMSMALVTGLYGMNFRNIPELSWEYGYFYAIGLMAAVGAVLYLVLRRKGWL